MNGRWFFIDGVLTELRGSDQSIREELREYGKGVTVRPARPPIKADPAQVRASTHRRGR